MNTVGAYDSQECLFEPWHAHFLHSSISTAMSIISPLLRAKYPLPKPTKYVSLDLHCAIPQHCSWPTEVHVWLLTVTLAAWALQNSKIPWHENIKTKFSDICRICLNKNRKHKLELKWGFISIKQFYLVYRELLGCRTHSTSSRPSHANTIASYLNRFQTWQKNNIHTT